MMQHLQRLLRSITTRRWWFVGVLVALVVVVWPILLTWTGSPPEWTGFGPISGAPNSTHISLVQPAKTLWDWLQLLSALLVPVVVGFAGLSFTRKQSQTERKIAEDRLLEERRLADDRQREAALETYFDRVSQLLLDEGTRGHAHESHVQAVARARTVTTMRRLDGERNGSLLRFLRESHLMDVHGAPIDLSGADLTGAHLGNTDLSGINLSGATLSGADLCNANLSGTTLNEADLSGATLSSANLATAKLVEAILIGADLGAAYLREANLSGVNLREATLSGATLINADLTGASLRGANLRGANLIGANLSGANLKDANLDGAEMRGAILHGANLAEAYLSKAIALAEQLAEVVS
jgi:uncharacterized protein YjbI with pentapeptide repeats